jgi:hypothetical protein
MRGRYLWIIALAGMMFTAWSCEEVSDSNDIPYVQHLVVYSYLKPNDAGTLVSVRRTLPVSQSYTDSDAWITDANVTLTSDGQTYSLVHVSADQYVLNDITIQSGKTYHLEVLWRRLHTAATTTVPFPAPIDTGRVEFIWDSYGYVDAVAWLNTHVSQRSALLATYMYRYKDTTYVRDTNWMFGGVNFRDVTLAEPGQSDSVRFRTYSNVNTNFEYRAVLYTYDPAYYEFAQTYYRDGDDGGPFGSGGTNPKWNLDGDGIGLFIGVATAQRDIPFP